MTDRRFSVFLGHGAMGISNTIGSNVFDVLLCLGLPWFLKATLFPAIPNQHYVKIISQGLVYSSISLFSTLAVLYLSLVITKFKLTRTVGIACLITYAMFLAFASILELNTFFVVNLPTCVHWYIPPPPPPPQARIHGIGGHYIHLMPHLYGMFVSRRQLKYRLGGKPVVLTRALYI